MRSWLLSLLVFLIVPATWSQTIPRGVDSSGNSHPFLTDTNGAVISSSQVAPSSPTNTPVATPTGSPTPTPSFVQQSAITFTSGNSATPVVSPVPLVFHNMHNIIVSNISPNFGILTVQMGSIIIPIGVNGYSTGKSIDIHDCVGNVGVTILSPAQAAVTMTIYWELERTSAAVLAWQGKNREELFLSVPFDMNEEPTWRL